WRCRPLAPASRRCRGSTPKATSIAGCSRRREEEPMNRHRNILLSAFSVLAVSMYCVIPAEQGAAPSRLAPTLTRAASTEAKPDGEGFIRRWILLEPIPANGLTDS